MTIQPVRDTPRAMVAFARAVRLRCPRCGTRGILKGWFGMRPACPTCALPLGEHIEGDNWFGASVLNIMVAELLTVAGVAAYVIWTLPAVPWGMIEWVGIGLAVASPIVLYPFSRVVWVAFVLLVEKGGERPHR
jgi:uncharacterized protein (DUF983 family)